MNQSMGYPRSVIRDNTRVNRIPIVRIHNKRLNTRRFIAHVRILIISKPSGIGEYVYFLAVPRYTRTVLMSSASESLDQHSPARVLNSSRSIMALTSIAI